MINYCNNIVDDSSFPRIELLSANKEMYSNKVIPNFIYNRFDLRFGKDFDILKLEENKKTFYIPFHIDRGCVTLGVWLTPISYSALDELIKYLFKLHKKVRKIHIRYSLNQYAGLNISNHWVAELSDNIETFDKLLSSKTRYNTKWYPKKIQEDLGDYTIEKLSLNEISENVVKKYFEFKYETHKQQYKMNEKEYLKNFYVNYAYILKINNKIEAVLFDSNLGNISYLENFAFNPNLSKYSLGMVIYHYYINDLINNGVKYIYLGDGMQEYKRRFNGKNLLAFDGYVRRKTIYTKIKTILKNIKRGIYGTKEIKNSF